MSLVVAYPIVRRGAQQHAQQATGMEQRLIGSTIRGPGCEVNHIRSRVRAQAAPSVRSVDLYTDGIKQLINWLVAGLLHFRSFDGQEGCDTLTVRSLIVSG
jgi:hypothetical protein